MKKNWFYLTLMMLMLAFVACSEEKEYVEPQLEVTPHNIAGEWMLKSFGDGQSVAEGCYLYLELVRNDHTFTLYDNLDSFGTVVRTGRYVIETDPELGAVIRGNYDFGGGDWNHRYVVRSLTAGEMVWVATDNPRDVSVYVRTEIPAEIK